MIVLTVSKEKPLVLRVPGYPVIRIFINTGGHYFTKLAVDCPTEVEVNRHDRDIRIHPEDYPHEPRQDRQVADEANAGVSPGVELPSGRG